jgi:hypothetical protein
LLDRQLRRLEQDYMKDGDITEKMYNFTTKKMKHINNKFYSYMTQAGHLFPLCFVLDSTTKQSNHNENTTALERQIDVIVYKLY